MFIINIFKHIIKTILLKHIIKTILFSKRWVQRKRKLKHHQARKAPFRVQCDEQKYNRNGKRCRHCEFLKDAVRIVDSPQLQIRCTSTSGNHVVEYLPKRRARREKTTTAGIRTSESVVTIIA